MAGTFLPIFAITHNRFMNTIIFDLGGVLIDWNPRYLYRKLFQSEAEMERFLEQITTSDWNEAQDAGRPLAEGTQLLVDRYPDHRELIEAFYGRWEEMLGGAISGTVEILENFRNAGHHRLYALTNWSAETWPIALRRFEFLHWFEDVLVSGKEGIRKPDPAFYGLLRERFGIEFADALFIDDNLRNVLAARELGLDTIHFQTPGQLRTELQARRLLVG